MGLRSLERRASGQRLEQDGAEREQIASSVEPSALDLLGRHVGGRADERVRLREPGLRLALGHELAGRQDFAMPKSSTFGWPAGVSAMFAGFRSR